MVGVLADIQAVDSEPPKARSNSMQVPIQIVSENVSQSEALATRIRDRVPRVESAQPQ
jgi:hypothetical protein